MRQVSGPSGRMDAEAEIDRERSPGEQPIGAEAHTAHNTCGGQPATQRGSAPDHRAEVVPVGSQLNRRVVCHLEQRILLGQVELEQAVV